jgi:hypothetical protein
VWVNGTGNGFQFNAAADTRDRTLTVYVGLWKARGKFEASLSDGSAAPYVDTSLDNRTDVSERAYTITYRAASAGQRLTVKWTTLSTYDPRGNITLQAATLAGSNAQPPPPPPPPPPTTVPQLTLSTYGGGNAEDTARDIAVTDNGIYVTGGTMSSNFPTTAGAYDRTYNGTHDVWVRKYSLTGQLIWSTLIGGPNYDRAYAIEVDSTGVYVAGRAGAGFPTTPGALQDSFAGDNNPNGLYGQQDGFVAKLSLDGSSMLWATYIGGPGREFIRDIDIDGAGAVYAAMADVTAGFQHISSTGYDRSSNGGFDGAVVKIDPTGSNLVYGTYIGGAGYDGGTPAIRVNSSGEAYYLEGTDSSTMPVSSGCVQPRLGGRSDLHLAHFSADGSYIIASTYYGGSNIEFIETHTLALDQSENPVIAGTTMSSNLPVTAGCFQRSYGGSGGAGTGNNTNYQGDGFIAKISADCQSLLAATYLGGSVGEGLQGIAVDSQGRVYVSGASFSSNFPVTGNAVQTFNLGQMDGFISVLSSDLGTLTYSTYLGGSGADELRSLDYRNNKVYVAGHTVSGNFPTANAQQAVKGGATDMVVCVISMPGR